VAAFVAKSRNELMSGQCSETPGLYMLNPPGNDLATAWPPSVICAINAASGVAQSGLVLKVDLFFARVSLTGFFEINLRLFAASWQNCTS